MNIKLKTLGLALTSLLVLPAVAGSPPAATAKPQPEYGFRGLKRVEVVFLNVGRSGMPKDSPTTGLPADDLASHDLEKDPECGAIGKTLLNAGLEVVDRCKPDDLACGQLYLTVENHSSGRVEDRIYLVRVELRQRVYLARDKKVELAMPSTWWAHRVAVVAADQSATSASCTDLRGLATWFGSNWKLANK